MSTPQDLIRRFIDDGDSLSDSEWTSLLEAVESSPELLRQLRDQCVVDELLSQKMSRQRGDFSLQVDQRIADYSRGESDLTRHATEIHELAVQLGRQQTQRQAERRGLWPFMIAAALLLFVGLAAFQFLNVGRDRLAGPGEPITVAHIDGEVLVRSRAGENRLAEVSSQLAPGDRILIQGGAWLVFAYADGTQIRVSPHSALEVREASEAFGKRLELLDGEINAVVAKQPANRPFEIATRNAAAVVRGTRFSLRYRGGQTELDVDEGAVELFDGKGQNPRLASTGESLVASGTKQPTARSMPWPSNREHLILSMADGHHVSLWRDVNALPDAVAFDADGNGADWTSAGAMVLEGGWFHQRQAGEVAAERINASRSFAIEMVMVPESVEAADGSEASPKTLVAIGPVERPNVAIRQLGDKLVIELAIEQTNAVEIPLDGREYDESVPPAVHRIELGTIRGQGKAIHWRVNRKGDDLIVSIEGNPSIHAIPKTPWREWVAGPLSIGASADGSGTWHGQVLHFALHAFPVDQVTKN